MVLPVDVAVDVGVGLARIDVAVVVAVDEMLVVAVDVRELDADEVTLDVAVDVAELVAVLVSEDVAVVVSVDVREVVMEVVAVDVSVELTVDVTVDVCDATHASQPTGHISEILTPNRTVAHAYERTSFAQLSRSSLPLHKPWVVAVVVTEDVAVDCIVVVAVVMQFSAAVMETLVRFCLTTVFSA